MKHTILLLALVSMIMPSLTMLNASEEYVAVQKPGSMTEFYKKGKSSLMSLARFVKHHPYFSAAVLWGIWNIKKLVNFSDNHPWLFVIVLGYLMSQIADNVVIDAPEQEEPNDFEVNINIHSPFLYSEKAVARIHVD